MSIFFPPALTSERRREIIVFKQGDNESHYNVRVNHPKIGGTSGLLASQSRGHVSIASILGT